SGGGSLRAQGRHQAAADHDQRRLAGDDGPHQRQRERGHHDLDLGAGANPRREGHPDRGHGERAARRISRSADVQGSGLRRPHGGDVVRAVGAGGLAERYHAAPQRGGGPDVGAARRAQTPRPRRRRDARHDFGRVHGVRGERDRQMDAGGKAGDAAELGGAAISVRSLSPAGGGVGWGGGGPSPPKNLYPSPPIPPQGGGGAAKVRRSTGPHTSPPPLPPSPPLRLVAGLWPSARFPT